MTVYDSLRSLILPLEQIEKHSPKKGKIVEFGCGQGVISKYLAKNADRKIIGIDIDKSRLPKNSYSNLNFVQADIRKYLIKNADCVIISDVLHHLNRKDQKNVINNIYKGLKKEGVFIIKEIDTDEFIRSKLSRIWDFILYPKDKIYFSSAKSHKKNLEKTGFKVKFIRTSRLFPGSTNLFICKK